MSPNRDIHKHTWTSPDVKIDNQIDHILIGRKEYQRILDVRFFSGADCDTDHYLVVAKVRERLAVNKQAAQKFALERFNLRKLSQLMFVKQYQIDISKRFAALEKLNDSDDINMTQENILENINTSNEQIPGLYKLKQHKPGLMKIVYDFRDQKKQAKTQWLRCPTHNTVDNPKNLRREASRNFKKQKAYMKAKIDELETNSKAKNIRDLCRGVNVFKQDHQPRTNIVKDENGDLVTDSSSTLVRWRNHLSQLSESTQG